jgi:FXSXX-COOH protein
MAAAQVEAVESGIPDIHDLPLDVEVGIGDVEYGRIMRRILGEDGGSDTPVSAFNSSI